MKFTFLWIFLIITEFASSQKLAKAFEVFKQDPQLKYAISSLYVIDAKTGEVVFDENSRVGLAPASTQKVVTASAALDILGQQQVFVTTVKIRGRQVIIEPSGDPSFGSWRYASSKKEKIIQDIADMMELKGLKVISDTVLFGNRLAGKKEIPSGWINEDIGNYYGAAANGFIWNENQYDLVFIPGKKAGDETVIDTAASGRMAMNIINECKTGAPGSGDNAYIYFIPGENKLMVKGTVPAGPSRFKIAGSDYAPELSFLADLQKEQIRRGFISQTATSGNMEVEYKYMSPALDSMIYWFLQKSINLYGEALIKTIALRKRVSEKNTDAGSESISTSDGVDAVLSFWKQKGIDVNELNMSDGSGLSPQNRVTTHAQVEVLKYAKTRDWFPAFYAALPTYNNMKMKSGTINGAKGFCGYQVAKDGHEYIFSFLVNNFNGTSSGVVGKMFKVLDLLK